MPRVPDLRRAILTRAFDLLYGPLAALHEPAGRLLGGPAWARRRAQALEPATDGVLLDLGCGDGRLLALAGPHVGVALGVDASVPMTQRARRRGIAVVRATAGSLPFADASIAVVTSTYPGAWIFDAATVCEIARVLRPGGEIRILLGGTVRHGSLAGLRRLATRAVYGRSSEGRSFGLPPNDVLDGAVVVRIDDWGESIWWLGHRLS